MLYKYINYDSPLLHRTTQKCLKKDKQTCQLKFVIQSKCTTDVMAVLQMLLKVSCVYTHIYRFRKLITLHVVFCRCKAYASVLREICTYNISLADEEPMYDITLYIFKLEQLSTNTEVYERLSLPVK